MGSTATIPGPIRRSARHEISLHCANLFDEQLPLNARSSARPSPVNLLPKLAWATDLDRQFNRRLQDVLVARDQHLCLPSHCGSDDPFVVGIAQPEIKMPPRFGDDQTFTQGEYPHDTAEKTSSSVRSPRASANGRTMFRRRSKRSRDNWRRRASRARSLRVRPVCFARRSRSRSSSASSLRVNVPRFMYHNVTRDQPTTRPGLPRRNSPVHRG